MKKLIILLIIIFNILIIFKIIDINIINKNYYINKYNEINKIVNISNNVKRGRILDKNGKILVDNKGVRSLIFNEYLGNIDKIYLANLLSNIIDYDEFNISEDDINNWYIKKYNNELLSYLDNSIIKDYKSKLITEFDYNNYLYKLIDNNKINKKEAYIYKLLNTGYSYENKIIKKNITDKELNLINDLNISSIYIDYIYERVYNYDTCLNDLFGSVGYIQKEELNEYLNKGYNLNDLIGISFLEKTYDEYLRGIPAKYKIENNKLIKISDNINGNDLVLSIDIDKQLSIENILKSEMINLKKYKNSIYYNGSYIVVSNPNNGEIDALVALKFNNDKIVSNSIGMLTNSFTVGSVVKGASMTVLYKYLTGLDRSIKDGCIKLKNNPEKCSWTNLGYLNDIDAIKYSSNYYQFINAIKVSGYDYKYDMKFNPNINDFNKYRSIFKSYGLGSLTGIDIDGEQYGITGNIISGDLLLNLSIGQYDTYTPLMLNNYISTIANGGIRYKLNIVSKIIKDNNIIKYNKNELNRVDISDTNMNRLHDAFRSVIANGTATSYGINKVKSSGKTGTSETYYNNEATTTKSFIMYAPSDNPRYAISIISPHIYVKRDDFSYKYPINSKLSTKILNILFEK